MHNHTVIDRKTTNSNWTSNKFVFGKTKPFELQLGWKELLISIDIAFKFLDLRVCEHNDQWNVESFMLIIEMGSLLTMLFKCVVQLVSNEMKVTKQRKLTNNNKNVFNIKLLASASTWHMKRPLDAWMDRLLYTVAFLSVCVLVCLFEMEQCCNRRWERTKYEQNEWEEEEIWVCKRIWRAS